jgi:glycosyltransferase involved in cell wall biosynthesis
MILSLLNFPSHYRANIYLKIEEELNSDFVFGNIDNKSIKTVDFNKFKKKPILLKTIKIFGSINYIKGSLKFCFKSYNKYLITGEYYCISVWMILIINKLCGKKTYLWTHGWYGNENILKRIIKKIFFSLSDGIFLYGNYARDIMIKEGFNSVKLHVIYNSLNYENQKLIRDKIKKTQVYENKFQNTDPVIIFIGRLTKVKKLELFLNACSNLIESGIHCNMVIVGDGDESKNLKSLINNLNLDSRCWFYGATHDELIISELIYNSTLCLSPGNVGLTAIHSLSFGTPVITHDNFSDQMPEFESIKDCVTGLFFKQNDMQCLQRKIIKGLRLFKNKDETFKNCTSVIDSKYNPNYQIKIFKKVLECE